MSARRWGRALAVAAALGALAPAPAAARRGEEAERDSPRVARRIIVDDQGVRIVGDDQRTRRVVRERGAEVRIDVDPERGGIVEVDGDADTLAFQERRVTVVGPGLSVNVDESGMVRMFSDAEVHEGERVEGDVVAVFGDVRVDGQVSGNVVAVGGSVRLAPGARIDGDAVAVGGVLDQPAGATVGGESVSLGFLPLHWGVPTLGMMLGTVLVGWLLSLFMGWVLFLLFPSRMLRTAVTASQRTGGSLVLGLISGPLLVIAIVLLMVTVIGIPIAVLLPLLYLLGLWAGQLALTYALGCRLTRRRLGEGDLMMPLVAGTVFVATFFVLGTLLGGPEGAIRTIALFFSLLGVLLVMGLSLIGVGAFLLSRLGTRPRGLDYRDSALVAAPAPGAGSPAVPPAA